ncbi:hypothetical protein GIX81_10875 [Lactobacillus reuteri]|uniref:Uncharacterized protein n=1 Tax=Limosilactobacillus reuteri TaxID=1598 RepID=A0A6L5P6A8_LIMRT|nr:hypothetical protein [Limosilactobacillus reuteri]MRH09921.1 hypothetical protein [Limosilactobacillus reuteri]
MTEQNEIITPVFKNKPSNLQKHAFTARRTIPFRVDTLNNKSANSRGCFSFLVIPQQKN